MIGNLLSGLGEGLRTLATFVTVVVLGLLVAIVWVLPWLIRTASVVAWLGGAYQAGESLRQIYGGMTETVPMMALWTIPAILAAVVPVWMFYTGQLSRIWGAFFLYGLLAFGFHYGSAWLLANWKDADLFFRAAPILLLTVLVFVISIRLRALRFRPVSSKGGDTESHSPAVGISPD